MAADQTRPARASVKAHPKANSDTETSWPSEDPPNPSPTPHKGEGENSSMMQLEQRAARRENAQHNDELVLMKQGKAVGLHKDQDRLYTGAALANFNTGFTLTFQQPNEYATQPAYHACYYLNKLRDLQQPGRQVPQQPLEQPTPTDFTLNIHNPLIEAEATLSHLANHHEELPMRHIQRELVRAENLLKEGRALLKSWAKDPEAPGASPGTAATRNTLDGIDWALLAAEEGGVASLEEALKTAASAARRSNGYMEELVAWLKGHRASVQSNENQIPSLNEDQTFLVLVRALMTLLYGVQHKFDYCKCSDSFNENTLFQTTEEKEEMRRPSRS
ncbi:unnamed protein product [Symbiodinium sp. KB8]|nr:unnamed protein product [Symbiodinium sp. KB8]